MVRVGPAQVIESMMDWYGTGHSIGLIVQVNASQEDGGRPRGGVAL